MTGFDKPFGVARQRAPVRWKRLGCVAVLLGTVAATQANAASGIQAPGMDRFGPAGTVPGRGMVAEIQDSSPIEDRSRIEIWDEETGQRRIILMKEGEGTQEVTVPPSAPPGKPVNPPTAEQGLSAAKLRKLIKNLFREGIPLEFYADEDYRAFFAEMGVQTPEDLKDRKKVFRIRREAHRRLLKLRKK